MSDPFIQVQQQICQQHRGSNVRCTILIRCGQLTDRRQGDGFIEMLIVVLPCPLILRHRHSTGFVGFWLSAQHSKKQKLNPFADIVRRCSNRFVGKRPRCFE